MKKVSSSPIFAGLGPDPELGEPLHRQLYAQIREQILGGRLAPGVRMPSTRELAKELGVSRNTVLCAFDQLGAEGYFESATGSGTYVARCIPEQRVSAVRSASLRQSSAPANKRLSQAAVRASRKEARLIRGVPYRPFQPGFPAIDLFPLGLWTKIAHRQLKMAKASLLGYGVAAGFAPLRKAIATHLGATRGVRCEPEQVIVVSGAQQAFGIIARTLLDPGDSVIIEDPGYSGARLAFEAAALHLVPAPVDGEGLNIREVRLKASGARLVYTTPSHHYPLGAAMSVARRIQLVNWAATTGAWIIEDDYDGEYRYASRPLAALQSFDHSGSVIYVGTFSKVLFPALRLAYIVAPPRTVDAFLKMKIFADYHSPTVEQAVVAEFIEEGHLVRHIRRMRVAYLERMETMLQALQSEAGGLLALERPDAGMHVACSHQ